MKIRTNYYLYINDMLGNARYGNFKFYSRLSNASIGYFIICSFSEIKQHIKNLNNQSYEVYKMKW